MGYQVKQREDSRDRLKKHKNIPLHDKSKASLRTGALRSLLFKSDERTVTNYRLLGHTTAPRPRLRELLLFNFSTVNFRKKIQIQLTCMKDSKKEMSFKLKITGTQERKRPTDRKQDSARCCNENCLQEGLNLL